MKTKSKEASPSRFTRGERVTVKGAKRHTKKTSDGESRPKEESGAYSPAVH